MASDTPKRRRSHHPERVTLDSEAFERIERWVAEIQPHLKGSRFTRSDMVNEIIKRHSLELSSVEVNAITAAFFDPARALLWAAKEVKAAQKSGQDVDLGELLNGSVLPKKRRAMKRRKKAATEEPGKPTDDSSNEPDGHGS